MVWCSRLSSTAMEMGLPQKLKVVSWEQLLREGRRALNWVSMMLHSSRSRSYRVAEVLSIGTCRGSKLRLVRLTPLRPRSFSRPMLGHCDRYVTSHSEIRQLVIDRVSRGSSGTWGERGQSAPGAEVAGGGMWEGEVCFTGTQGISLAWSWPLTFWTGRQGVFRPQGHAHMGMTSPCTKRYTIFNVGNKQ